MDLIELARTVQEDHRRQIEAETRRRRLLDTSTTSAATSRNLPPTRGTSAGTPRSGQSVPSASTAR
jgi:hypothetical protein